MKSEEIKDRTIFEEYMDAVEATLLETEEYNGERDCFEVPASSLRWLQAMHRLMTKRHIEIQGDLVEKRKNGRRTRFG